MITKSFPHTFPMRKTVAVTTLSQTCAVAKLHMSYFPITVIANHQIEGNYILLQKKIFCLLSQDPAQCVHTIVASSGFLCFLN